MPFSVPPQVKVVTTAVATYNDKTPFLPDAQMFYESAAGSTVYGAKHPGTNDTKKYVRISNVARSAGAAWTVPSLLNAMHDIATAVTDATRLRVIALKNGVSLKRVANDATPGAGEFQQTDTTTVKFGDAIAASDVLELIVLDAADIVTVISSGTAGRIYEKPSYTFLTASDVTNLTPATRG